MALNKVMLIGNVGHEPEVRYLDKNNANDSQRVASLRLATTDRYKDREGNLKEVTEWHSIVCWGRTAELVEKYVRKGSSIYVEGSLRSREYIGKDGVKKNVTEIKADSIQLLGKREQPQDGQSAPAPVQQQAKPSAPVTKEQSDNDDFPF